MKTSAVRVRVARVLIALVAVTVFASGCSAAEQVLTIKDKNEFVEAANAFIGASNKVQTEGSAAKSADALVAVIDAQTPTMKAQLAKMESIEKNLKGDPQKIAQKGTTAANEVLKTTEAIKTAALANDRDAVMAAAEANSAAIQSFNNAAQEWNNQKI